MVGQSFTLQGQVTRYGTDGVLVALPPDGDGHHSLKMRPLRSHWHEMKPAVTGSGVLRE